MVAVWGDGLRWEWHHLRLLEKSVTELRDCEVMQHHYWSVNGIQEELEGQNRIKAPNPRSHARILALSLWFWFLVHLNVGHSSFAVFVGWIGLPIKVVFLLCRCCSLFDGRGRCCGRLLQLLHKWAKQAGTWAERESNTEPWLPVQFAQFAGALIQSALHPKHDRNCVDVKPPTEISKRSVCVLRLVYFTRQIHYLCITQGNIRDQKE